MNRIVRSLFSTATLALLILYGRSLQQTLLAWSGLAAILLIYLVMIWVQEGWWSRTKYVLATGLVITLTLLLHLLDGSSYSGALLIPLIMVLAKEQQSFRRLAVLLAVITMAVMGLLVPAPGLLLSALPGIIALYMSIRAINIYKEAYRLSQRDIHTLAEAHQELRQTHAALQEASVHSMRYAALAERTRLAREIHDGLGHQLTSLIVQLQALEIMLPSDPAQAANAVPDMLEVARKAMAEVRLAVRTWREDESGLGLVALQGLVSQYATYASLTPEFFKKGDLSEWPVELSVALYRILQEALTNIMRHAEATAVCVQVEERQQEVILTVSDNGRYTEDQPLAPGYGIKGIMERCQALGGWCRISQIQPHGLSLQVTLPTTQPGERNPAHSAIPAGQGREIQPRPAPDWRQ